MVRGFRYKGENFRVTAHGIPGHEEVFVVHIDRAGLESEETSIDRMTEPNDRSAPIEQILVMLCERLIPDIAGHDPSGPFIWRDEAVKFKVHNGVQELDH